MRTLRSVAGAAVFLLVLTACGDDGGSTEAADERSSDEGEDTSEFCEIAEEIDELDSSDFDSDDEAEEALDDLFAELVDAAPADLRDDVELATEPPEDVDDASEQERAQTETGEFIEEECGIEGAAGDDEDGDEGASGDPQQQYVDAVEALDDVESGVVDAELRLVLSLDFDQEIVVAEKATFASGGGADLPEAEIVIDVTEGENRQHIEVVHTGDDFFTKEGEASTFAAEPPENVQAIQDSYRDELEALDPGRLPLLALTPADWVTSAEFDGEEDLNGAETTRIVGELDVPTFLSDLQTGQDAGVGMGASLSGTATELLEPGANVERGEVVALVDEDGLLRKLTVTMLGNVTGGSVSVDFDVELSELNEPQEIVAPI